jgi:transposase
VATDQRGHERLIAWARSLAPERRFALEDCRHVSGRLERFLIAAGERCVRVPPKLMAQTRRSARRRGKSDAIDAACVARAALREPGLPKARLEGPERELRLLADHRADLVGERTRIQQRLRWHLHDLGLGLEVPPKALGRASWLARLEEALAPLEGVQARLARILTERCRSLTREIDALEREIAARAAELAPELLALPGCGALSAACLLGETAGAERFASAARFSMHAGVAPLPISSGQSNRYRLNRRGNLQLNAAPGCAACHQPVCVVTGANGSIGPDSSASPRGCQPCPVSVACAAKLDPVLGSERDRRAPAAAVVAVPERHGVAAVARRLCEVARGAHARLQWGTGRHRAVFRDRAMAREQVFFD